MSNGNVVGKRWTKHGKDRLFVYFDSRDLGWVDLKDGTLKPADGVPVQVLAAGAARASKNMGIPLPRFKYRGLPWPDATPQIKSHDLAGNTAGKSVTAQARKERGGVTKAAMEWMGKQQVAAAGITREDQIWDAGAKGERIVGKELERVAEMLGAKVLHSVPIGDNGADIDHVIVGDFGIVTVNTKYHPNKIITVNGDSLTVNGEEEDYLVKSFAEAERAARALSRAAGWPPPVTSAIILAKGGLSIMRPNSNVDVLKVDDVERWMKRMPRHLNSAQLSKLYAVARNKATWTTVGRQKKKP